MNSFESCNKTAEISMSRIIPFLEERGDKWVLTSKGRLSQLLQKTIGDMVLNDCDGNCWTVECKSERSHTGNLFLEIWSNFNYSGDGIYASRGPTPGWLLTLNAGLLFYHFLDNDKLYIMSLPKLQRWAFCSQSRYSLDPRDGRGGERLAGRVFDFRRPAQGKHSQLNRTVGAVVPISTLREEMPISEYTIGQLEFELFSNGVPV